MLPKVNSIMGSLKLPVLGKTVRVQSFTLKEEKILVMNGEFAENTHDIYTAVTELVRACLVDKLDVESLTQTDVIALFVKIIEISKGTEVNQVYICQAKNEGEPCNTRIEVTTNLSDYEVVRPEKADDANIIPVTDSIKIVVEYPSIRQFMEFENTELSPEEATIRLFAGCISEVYNGESVSVRGTDFTDEEIIQWVEGLTTKQLEKFSEFVATMPYIRKNVEIVCPRCGNKEVKDVMSLSDFFSFDTPRPA